VRWSAVVLLRQAVVIARGVSPCQRLKAGRPPGAPAWFGAESGVLMARQAFAGVAHRRVRPYHAPRMNLGLVPSVPPPGTEEEAACTVVDGDAGGGLLVLCDHASNRVPGEYGNLGLPEAEFARHIAFDPGAATVARRLALKLRAPAVMSTFSRLLIDPNRGDDDPTLIMRLSDGTAIPGNAAVDPDERARRLRLYHAPYHAAIEAAIGRALATGRPPILVSIHSFTPVWRGRYRPWHAGILWDRDDRLAAPLIEALRTDPQLVVGDNEPYSGALANDTMARHGTARGLAHALVEIRQDLIGEEAGAIAWADRLAATLSSLNGRDELHMQVDIGAIDGEARSGG
jgi:predicted N-formylglutamate amidohydrolase